MAVLTTPSIILQYTDSVYTHPEAVRYTTPLAMTTLGNVNATPAELESDTVFSHRLWWISSIEALGSLCLLCMVLRASSQMSTIQAKVDKDAVTMADYTVMVQPKGVWSAYTATCAVLQPRPVTSPRCRLSDADRCCLHQGEEHAAAALEGHRGRAGEGRAQRQNRVRRTRSSLTPGLHSSKDASSSLRLRLIRHWTHFL